MAKNKKCCKKCSCGFTLIELLVVIAIIGILSTIVLVSLNTARTKAADVTTKANLKTIQPQSELVYDSNIPNAYTGTAPSENICANAIIVKALTAAAVAGGGTTGVCNNSATAWAAQSPLKSGGYWCVDSVGNNKAEAAALGVAPVCP